MNPKLYSAVTLAALALLVLVGWTAQPQTTAEAAEPGIITVTGEAEIRVVPDEVVLTLGVETSHKNLDSARRENDRIVQALIKAAKAHGVAAEHIQTDYLNIEPRYDGRSDITANFVGYFVHRTVVITLRDVAKFEDLYAAALDSGANYVHGVQFRTTALRANRDRARDLAIRAAREKATALAEAAGQRLGEPRTINENSSGWWSGYGSWWGYRWGGGMTQNVIQESGSGYVSEDGSLAPGQIAVNASVTVSYELLP